MLSWSAFQLMLFDLQPFLYKQPQPQVRCPDHISPCFTPILRGSSENDHAQEISWFGEKLNMTSLSPTTYFKAHE